MSPATCLNASECGQHREPGHILVGFAHDPNDWISRVMAWFTHADYTHVVLISPSGEEYIEASSVGKPRGVRAGRVEDFLRKPNAVVRTIEHPNPDGVWIDACSQIGKQYDYQWLLGWLFRRPDWQRTRKWVCSELIAWACERRGRALFRGDHQWWVTPQMIYMVSEDA